MKVLLHIKKTPMNRIATSSAAFLHNAVTTNNQPAQLNGHPGVELLDIIILMCSVKWPPDASMHSLSNVSSCKLYPFSVYLDEYEEVLQNPTGHLEHMLHRIQHSSSNSGFLIHFHLIL